MQIIYSFLIPLLWTIYILYWWAKAKNVKATEHIHESMQSRLIRSVSMLAALVLFIFQNIPLGILDKHFIPIGVVGFWIGAAITASGVVVSIWARHHLGENWSQAVTIKKDHQLITSGPYAYVRHPIYTGLLLVFIGTATAQGKWRGLVAVVLVFGVLLYKLRIEEELMGEQFGESYELYSRKVAALIPYIL